MNLDLWKEPAVSVLWLLPLLRQRKVRSLNLGESAEEAEYIQDDQLSWERRRSSGTAAVYGAHRCSWGCP
jgi:hypothetical protein